MKNFLKYTIPAILIILSILSVYFGAYLPHKKAKAYVTALKNAPNVTTVEEYEENFNNVLDISSPIGDEEIAKYLGSDSVTIAMQGGVSEDVAKELVEYIEPHLFKNEVRHLIILGQLYGLMWGRYGGEEEYFKKSEEYFLKAKQIGPKLPPVLYTLFDLYYQSGDMEKASEIAGEILKYWPDDENVKNLLR